MGWACRHTKSRLVYETGLLLLWLLLLLLMVVVLLLLLLLLLLQPLHEGLLMGQAPALDALRERGLRSLRGTCGFMCTLCGRGDRCCRRRWRCAPGYWCRCCC